MMILVLVTYLDDEVGIEAARICLASLAFTTAGAVLFAMMLGAGLKRYGGNGGSHLCGACEYDLSGLNTDRCPECGWHRGEKSK